MNSALTEFSNRLADIVEQTSRDVVAIDTGGRFAASGLLWEPGVAATTCQLLGDVSRVELTLADGSKRPAEVAGRNTALDVAVLRYGDSSSSLPDRRPERTLRAGEIVLVVGRSPDTGARAAMGVLSSVSGPWRTHRGLKLDQFLRLDVALHPGSSGGAVVNTAGQVIGLATQAFSRFSVVAIPARTVERVVRQVLSVGKAVRGYLGVGLQPVRVSATAGIQERSGLILVSVEREGPAAKAGLLLGDTLLSINGTPVEHTDEVLDFLDPEWIGRTLQLELLRAGALMRLELCVGQTEEVR
jgi:S1-C subfamily serine protease